MTTMTPLSLKNVTVSTIKPYTESKHPAIVPSFFDLTAVDVYIPIVFFYKPHEGQQADAFINLVEKLKESLSKVLVPYFPMAGRWGKTYDARVRELECNNEGVPFIEAAIDEILESVVTFNNIEAMELLAGYQLLGLDPKVLNQDAETPLPPLFVQVTRFKCGSVVLITTFSHTTTDGKGMLEFMQAWSDIARQDHTSIVPIHDRSLTISMAEFMKSIAGDAGGEHVMDPENANTEEVDIKAQRVDPGFAAHSENTRIKILYVKRQVIEDLKREAALQNMNVTTVDLVTAHFWCSISRFPESMDGKLLSAVTTAVEGRTRYHDPPLPERYAGNVVVICSTPQVPASYLAAGKSALFAANIVHNTVRDINLSRWKSIMARLMGELKDFQNLKYRIFLMSSWFRFPMYEIDFGHGIGKPVFASVNVTCRTIPVGLAYIQPPPPALVDAAIASVYVAIASDDAVRTLFSDEQFRSFFLPFD